MITFIPRDKVSKNWIIIAPILSIVFTIFFGLLMGGKNKKMEPIK